MITNQFGFVNLIFPDVDRIERLLLEELKNGS